MIRIHHLEIEKVEEEFIEWIKRTHESESNHLLTIRSWLKKDQLYSEVNTLHSLAISVLEDETKSKRDLWKVLDLYKYYIENTYR